MVAALLREFAVAGHLRQMIVLTKMLHELPRLLAGHSSSSLAASSGERVTRLQPDVDRKRLVIDSKYDTCTKPCHVLAFKIFFGQWSRLIQPFIGTASLLSPPLFMLLVSAADYAAFV
jgi:hypothetical protein